MGSNFGDRLKNLHSALNGIKELKDTQITAFSRIYDTIPYGVEEQDDFLNMVISIETDIEPVQLLKEIKMIEEKTGRIKRERWHEREIDIDILLYGERIVNEKSLNIPHRELKKRDFFLVPLLEINPDLILPGEGIFLSSLKIVAEKSYIKGWNRNFFRMKRGVVFLDEK